MKRPRAGACAGSGFLRREPADFQVDEIIEMQPESAGEHVWLHVRKTGENTDYVARLLASAAGVRPAAVGYAGRKDRHAVTTQWFSVQLPGKAEPLDWGLPPSVEILESMRRQRKLQTGGLRGNRFCIRVRGFEGERELLETRLRALQARGAPNYFGAQRFGHDNGNIESARHWFGGQIEVRDRKQRGLLLSAARSALFNAILSQRVLDGSWCRALPGDLMMRDGRGSYFAFDAGDESIAGRVERGEIHPSGALWGRGQLETGADIAVLEQAVVATYPDLAAGLEQHGLRQERRALRVMPRELAWRWLDAAEVELSFTLPAGCFATTLLEELIDCR